MKKTLISFSFLIVFIVALAATYTTTQNGGWSTNSTWSGNAVPPNWANHTVNLNHNITSMPGTIAGFTAINLNAGKSMTRAGNLTLQQVMMNVNDGDITVNGDLTLSDTDLRIISGSLTVTGTLTINYSSTVTFDAGTTITVGALSISNNDDAILNNSGLMTVDGNVSQGGIINNLSGGTLQINGNHTLAGATSSIMTNSGTLNVTGDVSLPGSSKYYTHPGGVTIVDGNVAVAGNQNLVVGTNVAPPPYADMAIKGNLTSTSSGDVKIDQNGRFALFGDFSSSGGGVLFTVENGGQTYVHGNMTMTGGGGNQIINNNTTDPYGLYVNGTITNSNGGSSIDSNLGSQTTMRDTNVPFYNWVASLPDSPLTALLPITILYFEVAKISSNGIALKWATSMEKNFDHFLLERSGDGIHYETVARIEGKGESNVIIKYGVTDHSPNTGKNYYRLKNIDLDNTYEYSKLIMVEWKEVAEDFTVYPNPVVAKSFMVQSNQDFENPVKMELISSTGKTICQTELTPMNTVIDLPENIDPGMYILKLNAAYEQKTIRIVVK